ncbi:GlcG/HbpS family heme-binding protein [Acidianus manzaensis]|uniref:Cobalamin adenosyltransferase n=1 Tax=Acidianus manzaensis TaxID=282676 RepID=A0A1W6JWS5_9CREN|nr:heme-binding protein [Acidianus manzaensis]ARM74705.1 cobalamin adenosyltransferase [Acidianus manzaensis]
MNKTYEKLSITEGLALELINEAVKKARRIGKAFIIAIVDESGVLKAFLRMDNAPLISVQVAINKAYTAAGFGIPTHQWYEMLKSDPALQLGAPCEIDKLIIFGGGFPIVVNGKVIGGIGVSGGTAEEDMQVAQAALEILNNK